MDLEGEGGGGEEEVLGWGGGGGGGFQDYTFPSAANRENVTSGGSQLIKHLKYLLLSHSTSPNL